MLPPNVPRCPGEMYVPMTLDFACLPDECLGCARRTEGVRDYMAGAQVEWMTPPGKVPCPDRLEPKK